VYPDSFLVSLYVPIDDRRQASHRSSTPSCPPAAQPCSPTWGSSTLAILAHAILAQ
jgi:hypothetical protein